MDKKTTGLIIAMIVGTIGIIAVIFGLMLLKNPSKNNVESKVEDNNLYVITSSEAGYGISRTNGKVVLNPEYKQIARVNNTVYLATANDSYFYFLDTNQSVNLGKKETELLFAYSDKNELLPYFILRYGDSIETSIYKIYNEKGEIHVNRDFATLNDAYKYLKAKQEFTPIAATNSINSLYTIVATIPYPSKEGKTMYVVSGKDNKENKNQGIVDEMGRVILNLEYSKISLIANSNNAIKVEKEDKAYVFLKEERLIEIETGFDIESYDKFFLQKRGTTFNKIYNMNGEIVVSGIYKLNEDMISFNSISGDAYILIQDKKNEYTLYDVVNNKKLEEKYSNITTDYLKDMKNSFKSIGFMYVNQGVNKIIDFQDMKSYNLKLVNTVNAPLDMGAIYNKK